ncbi:MAG: hypothetical protein COA99_01925 [Moraxellaceae bacterium]|nr:MAG: hypothetical protein COA99_01925 [Moraxellaceae bacterium]
MYELMERYYDCTNWDRFNKDLDEKKHVILLFAGKNRDIKGFSTLMQVNTVINGRKTRAIFSGDTVVDQEYWGQRVLGRKFLSYLFMKQARHPLSPLYWLLISKGYKTYLLMSNNFREHYPRFETPTPSSRQKLIDVFANQLFGDSYNAESGCCRFSESFGQVRREVAPLDCAQVEKNARIKFFVDKNPGWSNGDELVCLARMSWFMPFYYLTKSWWKLFVRSWFKPGVGESKGSVSSTKSAKSILEQQH